MKWRRQGSTVAGDLCLKAGRDGVYFQLGRLDGGYTHHAVWKYARLRRGEWSLHLVLGRLDLMWLKRDEAVARRSR